MTVQPAQHRGALPRVSALLEGREQMQVVAATTDRLQLVLRTTITRIYEDVAASHADGVLISATMVREADVPRLCALVHELPATPIVGLVSDVGAMTVAGALLLGRAGIARLVDVRERSGWGALRNAFTQQLPEESVRAALGAILAAVEVEPDGSRARCSEGLRRFFSAIFAAHATTILDMAAEFGMPASTLMSRFDRASLPSPKQYLALAKLVRAAHLGESPGLTLRIIAERLHASSPQTYTRTVRNLTGMSAGEFRRGVHGPAMLDRFLTAVITPYRDILRTFDPLRSRIRLAASAPSANAA